jgi:molybdate transport system substrate-binding protein
MGMHIWIAAAITVSSLAAGAGAPPQRATIVAAAADLNPAVAEIAEAFLRDERQRVEFVFGSSGLLARQLHDGAPFELFLSADESFVEQLAVAGLTRDSGALYGMGRIVLFAPHGSPLKPEEGFDGLARLLDTGRVTRFAIANPEHAPYGRAAEAALRARGLWDRLQPRLVLGENVAQAAQFATTGNAVGGLIAYSLALSPGLSRRGTYWLVPDTEHPPLRQRMVLLRRAGPVAERFYHYLQEPGARAILEQSGFTIPK